MTAVGLFSRRSSESLGRESGAEAGRQQQHSSQHDDDAARLDVEAAPRHGKDIPAEIEASEADDYGTGKGANQMSPGREGDAPGDAQDDHAARPSMGEIEVGIGGSPHERRTRKGHKQSADDCEYGPHQTH